jgi:tetratricopeptide (TPR) repeat protein
MKYLQLIFISISLISCREIDAKKEYFKSLSYYKNGNYDKAIKSFSEIINQTDTCFDCYLHRGFAYRDFNQPGLAQNDFNKLINSELKKIKN